MTTWNELAASHKPRIPSRFERIVNGDRDHIHGYYDGEVMESQRPAGYYEDAPRFDELVALKALEGSDIY